MVVDRIVDAREVAQLLGVHINTVKRTPRGELPFFRVGSRGDRRYRMSDIQTYIQLQGGGSLAIAERYLDAANGSKIEAAAQLVMDLMRGDAEDYHLGYSLGNALIAVSRQFDLSIEQTAAVADWVTSAIGVHHSSTRRPLVIVHVGGGLVQWTHEKPGLGTPRVIVLDFDREGQVGDELREFLAEIDEASDALAEYDDPTNDRAVGYALSLARNEYQDLIDDGQAGRNYK